MNGSGGKGSDMKRAGPTDRPSSFGFGGLGGWAGRNRPRPSRARDPRAIYLIAFQLSWMPMAASSADLAPVV